MDYNTLLDMAAELGYQLAMCGAETFRVEESANRVLTSYGISSETFAIPNCLTVSIETAEGKPMTRMRRIGYHGNDMDGVEKFSALSRRICSEKPEPGIAMQWIKETAASVKTYPLPTILLGSILGSIGFSIFYGGTITDGLCAGICGLIGGAIIYYMDRLRVNQFFSTIASALIMALVAYCLKALGISNNVDAAIIGCLMLLVPGLIFTNAMRDIIYGDTNSGINRIVQVFLIAVAIAVGTGVAWSIADMFWHIPDAISSPTHTLLTECITCFIGCVGFCILFNVHGHSVLYCAAGGVITWLIYRLTLLFGGTELAAYFWATAGASLYAEIVARIKKKPAISYLVVSIFTLLPGAGLYYTMRHAVRGEMDLFAQKGMQTVALAGIMAVGILLSSTAVKLITQKFINQKAKIPEQ